MHSLIYASTATKAFSEPELLALLEEARSQNQRLVVTGMLLYHPGSGTERGTFVQVLEGEPEVVKSLYRAIRGDARHRDCTVVSEAGLFVRRFRDWSMGFRDVSRLTAAEVKGFNPIFQAHWTLKKILAEPDPVLRLLYSFAGEDA